MIAIHDKKTGFAPRWAAYCEEKQISYKLVNCYANDLIGQLKYQAVSDENLEIKWLLKKALLPILFHLPIGTIGICFFSINAKTSKV